MKIRRGQFWQTCHYRSASSVSSHRPERRSKPTEWWYARSLRIKILAYVEGFVLYRMGNGGEVCVAPRKKFLRMYIPFNPKNAKWTSNPEHKGHVMPQSDHDHLKALLKRQCFMYGLKTMWWG